ncbi:MAG: sodium:solute symporter family protein, partial [bacterium]|jgi:SSS family solute:Na+ symporter|nr:sodium:solute symporter family protein [bacterium]
MTLYQRMYACQSVKEAQRAWYIAGLFEYPVMAFTGVFLGMCSRVLFPGLESEMGVPVLIKEILPMGITGIVIASYFSAIMSTADSCLMASSGNFVNDILGRYVFRSLSHQGLIRLSQMVTLMLGVAAVLIASRFERVLDAILYAYAFMVSGLFVPTLGAYFWPRGSSAGALAGMLLGGTLTLLLLLKIIALPVGLARIGLDATLYGIVLSAMAYVSVSLILPDPMKGDKN